MGTAQWYGTANSLNVAEEVGHAANPAVGFLAMGMWKSSFDNRDYSARWA
ncbi:hypothetical protein HQ563_15830 [bacterium]|nr:hypothetical protein [bacterium]